MDSAVASSNEFNFKFLHVYRNENPDCNLFYSPVNIAICLSMLLTGAKEDTLSQIEEVLRNEVGQCNKEAFWNLSRYLQELSGPIILKTKNILAVDQQYPVLSEFLDHLKSNYNSEIKLVPFVSDPEKSRGDINRLIEEATNGKIKDMFVPGSISPDVKLVLANAIYFLGKWKDNFKVCETQKVPFYTISKEKVTVDMMLKEQSSYKYIHSEDLNASMLEMPYIGETVSMIILLPTERYGLPLLEKNISMEKINRTIGQMRMENGVLIGLPKFKLEESISLKESLCHLGITEAFTDQANFSGICAERNLCISSALHKTFLDVNEYGTEAAAATGIEFVLCCLPPPPRIHFIVDHPFMMFIRESATGIILFVGSIQNL